MYIWEKIEETKLVIDLRSSAIKKKINASIGDCSLYKYTAAWKTVVQNFRIPQNRCGGNPQSESGLDTHTGILCAFKALTKLFSFLFRPLYLHAHFKKRNHVQWTSSRSQD